MKKLLIPSAVFLLISCNLLNVHNVSNEFRWKNRAFDSPQEVSLDFDPEIIESYNDESYFLAELFQSDKEKIKINLKNELKRKLKDRNFKLKPLNSEHHISIDSLIFKEFVKNENVYTYKDNKFLGIYESYEVKFEIIGSVKTKDTMAQIKSKYSFKAQPREGMIIKKYVAYDNKNTNLNKVWENLLNKFGYRCYEFVQEEI
ncbi:hypothetical protein [Zunongwangia sp. HRR-M8]|uniref:hypothetical protein n=1 Tax=Zunongwangia sp. HRR-M8 TaxID=3015170 RepID=UPI0022DD8A35|nr:hypothetical protein [Zunongwangia sp. HRR-M8]WBL23497.1 hypothetical protein PBT89_05940 [Zunongwangia sp. HRR-M8]